MDEAIKIDSMFDGRSHHGSFRYHLWHRWGRWLVLRRVVCIAMVLIGGVFAIKTYGRGDKFANFITISFVLLGSVGYMRPMIWQMWNERKLRKHAAYGTEIHYVFSPEEIVMDGSSGKVHVPWSEFIEVVETKKGLLLYQNKKDYLWIPSYDFEAGEMGKVVRMFEGG
ncbi:MAG: YcxB family protein [Akkermansiaceae bacterium]